LEVFNMKRILLTLVGLLLLSASAFALVTPNSVVTAQTPNKGNESFGLTAACTAGGAGGNSATSAPYTCCTGSTTGCTAGTYYQLYVAGPNGSKCNALWVDTDDNATAHVVTCLVVNTTASTANGAVGNKMGGTVLTVTASGSSGVWVVPQNMLTSTVWPGLPVDSDGNPYLELNSGETLECTVASTTAITSGDQVDFHASCADF
jgi:hypothetical protein